MSIDYRQNVTDALLHKKTGLTPWAFEVTKGFAEAYEHDTGERNTEEALESHLMFGKYKKMTWLSSTLYEDIFGVKWQLGEDGGDIGIPVNRVINEDNIDAYSFPAVDGELLSKGMEAMKNDTKHFRMFRFTYALYERAWALRGMEELLLDMALNERLTMRLFERVYEYNELLLDAVLDGEFEGVYFGDDWGRQKGLIMGPDCWRKYIKPFMAKMFAKVKAKGKFVLLHSCGDIECLFPELIDMGLDCYNTVQPEIYDLEKIKREYGRDLAFWGAMSTQQFLPVSSKEEVFEKSVETIRILGENGGYIFSPTHAVTPDIPTENITAMKNAVKSVIW